MVRSCNYDYLFTVGSSFPAFGRRENVSNAGNPCNCSTYPAIISSAFCLVITLEEIKDELKTRKIDKMKVENFIMINFSFSLID